MVVIGADLLRLNTLNTSYHSLQSLLQLAGTVKCLCSTGICCDNYRDDNTVCLPYLLTVTAVIICVVLLLGEEAEASPSIGNTLWHVSTMFTSSAITPPEVNGFG